MGKKLALGKGIASLLQETPNQILRSNLSDFESSKDSGNSVNSFGTSNQQKDFEIESSSIEIERIKTNPEQPRKIFDEIKLEELADSIRENGILQPLIITKMVKRLNLLLARED